MLCPPGGGKRNGSYELKPPYPSDVLHAEELIEVPLSCKTIEKASSQPFRIYKITTPLTGLLEIAQGISNTRKISSP
jgi:phage-related protein